MLFLGTKDYPDEDSFQTFLSASGGASNAFTDSEDTVYYFDMTADTNPKLAEGLKRFGSFFTNPLFTKSATGRELNAIESENSKNLQSDIFRLYQLEKARANEQHPYSKFYTGNKQTLLEDAKKYKIDLRAELIKFWSTYYSADQMSLALVAPQPLPLMKKMVIDAFGSIPTNQDRAGMKPEQAWAGKIAPFVPGTGKVPGLQNIVEVVPVADLRQVNLVWPITFESVEDKEAQFLNKPAFYISHLLGHEGPNSLISYLKREGYANGLGSSTDAEVSDFYNFEVSVQLTTKGLENVDKIVESVYSYIRMLKEEPIPKYVFDECLQCSELEWRFLTKGDASSYAQSLVKGMQEYPEQYYIAGSRRLALRGADGKLLDSNKPRTSFESEQQLKETVASTEKLVSKLTVENCLVSVVSQSFEGKAKNAEKWYGTKYNVRPVTPSLQNQWTNCRQASNFGIAYPRPNVFIPDEKGLVVKKPNKNLDKIEIMSFEDRLKPVDPPELIRDDGEDGRWSVYFKQDDKFGQPKAYAIFQLLTKDTYSSPETAILAQLYQVSANDRLREYAYDAGLAGMSYDIQVLPRGVRLTFGGYNDKLLDFATYVSKKLSKEVTSLLPENDEEFERYRDEIVRALKGFDVQQPYSHAIYYTGLLLQPRGITYTNSQLRDAVEKVTPQRLEDYVKKVWSSGKGVALLQGNLDKQEALQFVDVVDQTLNFKSIPKEEIPPYLKVLPVPKSPAKLTPLKVSIAEPNPSNQNAVSQVIAQCLDTSEKSHVVVEIISAIISERFYEDLRTKQQLGYIVSSGVKAVSTSRNLSFLVQSNIAPPAKLTAAIFKFIADARGKFLENLTDEDIDVFARSSFLRKTDPDKKLATEATRNWGEISSGRFQFDRRQKEAQAVLDISKEDILDYWDTYVLGQGSGDGRRLLISEIVPKTGAASSKAPEKSYVSSKANGASSMQLGIDDVDSYRETQEKLLG